MKIFSRILKWSCIGVIAAVFALLIGRIALQDHWPASMTSYRISDAYSTAAADGEAPAVYRQRLRISYDDRDNGKYARFMASNQYYCPELGELQVTLRYNNSTLDRVREDFSLSETPEAADELFDFTVVDQTILNSDFDNENRAHLVHIESERQFMYTYLKLTFRGIDFEKADWLRIEIYYSGDVDYEEEAYTRLVIWERELIPDDVTYIP